MLVEWERQLNPRINCRKCGIKAYRWKQIELCKIHEKKIFDSHTSLLKKYSLATETTQSLSVTEIATRVLSSLIATEFVAEVIVSN